MLTMVHANPARLLNGVFRVDRKFHDGMMRYTETIRAPLTTIHPAASDDAESIDMIEISVRDLPYKVATIAQTPESATYLRRQISASRLVCTDEISFDAARLAAVNKIPYVLVLEYDLWTNLFVTTSQVDSGVRKMVRSAKCVGHHLLFRRRARRAASAIHCNGYPIYDEVRSYKAERVLYLDSRLRHDAVISSSQVRERIASLPGRSLRLLYSGRYEALKGPLDVVRAAADCLNRGLDVELHCYGQGSQAAAMRALAGQHPSRIFVHDAVTYPELVQISRSFDLFLCCHRQNDPSCTYLESFGSGLPIVGYANKMWSRLSKESAAGHSVRMGSIADLCSTIEVVCGNPNHLAVLSMKARDFAAAHTFEMEFSRRTDHLNIMLENCRK